MGATGSPSGNRETKRDNNTRSSSQRGAPNTHSPSANIGGLLLRLFEHSLTHYHISASLQYTRKALYQGKLPVPGCQSIRLLAFPTQHLSKGWLGLSSFLYRWSGETQLRGGTIQALLLYCPNKSLPAFLPVPFFFLHPCQSLC